MSHKRLLVSERGFQFDRCSTFCFCHAFRRLLSSRTRPMPGIHDICFKLLGMSSIVLSESAVAIRSPFHTGYLRSWIFNLNCFCSSFCMTIRIYEIQRAISPLKMLHTVPYLQSYSAALPCRGPRKTFSAVSSLKQRCGKSMVSVFE